MLNNAQKEDGEKEELGVNANGDVSKGKVIKYSYQDTAELLIDGEVDQDWPVIEIIL